MKHCCLNMEYYLTSGEEDLIKYNPIIRKYNFLLHKKGKRLDIRQELYYCPWCGEELPEVLDDKLEEVLEAEYGITEKDWDNEEKIPLEFKTDEWWKKRGL